MTEQRETHGEVERQRADATRNRAVILAAAARLRAPGSGLNMREVAGSAGVSRSTLYRHFPTRASLEAALRDQGIAAARQAAQRAAAERRPPLAALRRLITKLVELPRAYRLDLLGADRLRASADELALAALPLFDRLREAAEVEPALPDDVTRNAAAHVVESCLARTEEGGGESGPEADRLFRVLTDPLDQGLVVLDPDGLLLALNSSAAGALALDPEVDVGERVVEPRVEVIYEDGSPAPGETYPLAAAVSSGRPQPAAVRGHRD
ncbi:MAG: TetR/AcrR family transcriptional regulator, partial [Thermoleophilaceae bacterium]|nr:TetR/AcrR family transcriptional regulator [Thermoleophilaceae bacterium]